MYRTCISCGEPTIVASMIDGAIAVMEAESATDGAAPLKGDLGDRPTVIFGIESEEDAEFWGLPFESDRYNRHERKPVAS